MIYSLIQPNLNVDTPRVFAIIALFFAASVMLMSLLQVPKKPTFKINGGKFVCYIKHTISQAVYNNKPYEPYEWEEIAHIEKTTTLQPKMNGYAYDLPIGTVVYTLKKEFRNNNMPQYKSLSIVVGDIVWYAYPIDEQALKIVS